MNLYLLRYFQVVAQENHITRASQKLNIAQPALSTAISRLESEMGVPLFDRRGRQIVLNEYGKILLTRVNIILDSWDTACSEIKQQRRKTAHELKIATTTTYFCQKLIFDFNREYPDIIIKQSMVDVEHISTAVLKDKNDFVLSTIPIEDENIASRFLTEEELYVLVNKKHRLAGRESITVSDFAGESFVALPEGSAFRKFLDEFAHKTGFVHNVVFECFPPQIPELVSANIGIAFISESTLRTGMYPDSVIALPISASPCHRSLYMLWEKTKNLSETCRMFFHYATQYKFE